MATRSLTDSGATRANYQIERNAAATSVTVQIRVSDGTLRDVTLTAAQALPSAADRTEIVRLLGVIYANALAADGWT